MKIAFQEAEREDAFISAIDSSLIIGEARPDAIRHNRTFLPINVLNSVEVENTLSLLELMLNDQVPDLMDIFTKTVKK